MIVPIEWLKEYVKLNKSAQEISESFTALGLLLDKPIENNILDLEHRMDRSDWLSIVGCARDLAAMEDIPLRKPEGLIPESKGNGGVSIKVKAPDLVRRFNTRVFRNVTAKESPDWLKKRLESYGIPPKNNIVDITNYVMVELGQPMHAQDLAKFSKQEIVLRRAEKGEKITTLLGEEIELDKDTLVLAEGKNLIGIGAVVGGISTAVDGGTTDIVLDAGNYNQANIRKTSRRLNIRNETVLRTEKFLHPKLTQVAMERATKLILELAGGDYYENEDYYPEEVPPKKMTVRYSRITQIGGVELINEAIKNTLTALGYKILEENSAGLKVEVPYFRTDVEVEDDLASDILRINNYENIPIEAIDTAPPKEITPKIYDFEDKCRDELVKLGMHEHITNPLICKTGAKTQVELINALNSEQNALRTTIYETLKPVLNVYKKHKIPNTRLFEVGLTYHKKGKKFEGIEEIRTIEGICSLENGVREANDQLRQILSAFFKNLGVSNIRYKKSDKKALIYQEKRELGELRVDSFTLYTESLLKAKKRELRVKDTLTHRTYEDITFKLDSDTALGPILDKITNLNEKIADARVIDQFGRGDKVATTIRIVIEDASPIPVKLKKDIIQKAKKVV
jgi:phenylalanyl-tRNA synthetase beta chain